MPSLDLTRAEVLGHAGRNVAEIAHMGRAVWRQPLPTGGTITTATIDGVEYRIHTFTEDGELIAPSQLEVEYFLVGGGGCGWSQGAGNANGGSGAAGRVIHNFGAVLRLPAGSHPVSVGLGAPGGLGNTIEAKQGGDGSWHNPDGNPRYFGGGGGGRTNSIAGLGGIGGGTPGSSGASAPGTDGLGSGTGSSRGSGAGAGKGGDGIAIIRYRMPNT